MLQHANVCIYVTPPDRHIIILFIVKIWDGPIQYNMYYVKLSYASMYAGSLCSSIMYIYMYIVHIISQRTFQPGILSGCYIRNA